MLAYTVPEGFVFELVDITFSTSAAVPQTFQLVADGDGGAAVRDSGTTVTDADNWFGHWVGSQCFISGTALLINNALPFSPSVLHCRLSGWLWARQPD